MPVAVSGTEGYAEHATTLVERYESVAFADLHRPVLHLIPAVPCDVLDIGAGTGRDAAAFAARGHRVVAVEPTPALRTWAMALHPSPRIEWLDDSLPELAALRARGAAFDVVMLTAVWAHLDPAQRRRAMPALAGLLRAGGVLAMSLRHGPIGAGFRVFEAPAGEAIGLAQAQGLQPVVNLQTPSLLPGKEAVTWTRLAFVPA